MPPGFIVAFEGSKALSSHFFIEMIVGVVAIFFVDRMFGLTAVAFAWLACIVVDTLIIAATSLQIARRHRAHA